MDRNLNELMDSVKSRRASKKANRRLCGVTAASAALVFITWASIHPSDTLFKNQMLDEYEQIRKLAQSQKINSTINHFITPTVSEVHIPDKYNNLVTIIKSKEEKSMVTRISRNQVLDIINRNGGGEVSMNGKTIFVFSSW